ncbi:hypothetical protein LTR95_011697 [Oleoguttula sp. CCFEE 5521]
MVDHIFAGFDTGSITLMFLAWQVSKPENSDWQQQLCCEVARLDTLDSRTLDKQPVLHAVIMESLRLHAPVGGNQVRISPSNRTVLLQHPDNISTEIPPGTRIHAQAWSLHRNPAVFPEPDSWNPDRWLSSSSSQILEMNRWFWAFGSGSRMCAGTNLAMIEQKSVTAAVWRAYKTELVDGEAMVQNMGFIGGPLGKDGIYLTVRLTVVEV